MTNAAPPDQSPTGRKPSLSAWQRFLTSPVFGVSIGVLALLFGGAVFFERLSVLAAYSAEQTLLRHSRSLQAARARVAAERTAHLIEDRMSTTPVFRTRAELLAYSLQSVEAKGGLYCEFGVATGSTINYVADRLPEVTFHGFDSFEGLPEDWRTGFLKGRFAMDQLPEVRSNVKLYKGWFDETLPGFLAAETEHVSFAHLDADLYSSTKTVLEALAERLRPGSVLQFDEYFNYPGWQQGEFLAFEEFVENWDVKYEYLAYCDGPTEYAQVAVRIVSLGGAPAADSAAEQASLH